MIFKCGFHQCYSDHSVFVHKKESGVVILAVYVDDIIVFGSDVTGISDVKSFLQQQFQIKDLGSS